MKNRVKQEEFEKITEFYNLVAENCKTEKQKELLDFAEQSTNIIMPLELDYDMVFASLILPLVRNNELDLTKFEAYQRTYVIQGYGIHLKYLHWVLVGKWRDYNKDKMFGSAIPYIKLGNLENFPVPLPPLHEQERISAKIEELNKIIGAL